MSALDAVSLFDSLSNWGRWGDDDELGTLNYITPETVSRALSIPRQGWTAGLARRLDTQAQVGDLHGPLQRFLVRSGRPADVKGSALSPGRQASAAEYLGMVFHGPNVTHLDAPAHTVWDGRLYGGRSVEVVGVENGATVLSVLGAENGIVTRGVLLDPATVAGEAWLEPGTSVGPDVLERVAAACGVTVGRGDAVLLRTGYGRLRDEQGPKTMAEPWAGWGLEALPWLRDNDVALIGSDGFNECLPHPHSEVPLPVHAVGQVAMGLWLLDNLDLEQLAWRCSELGQWEFLLMLAPLPIVGGTGSPVNPVAVL